MPRLNFFAPIASGLSDAEASEGALEIINGYVDKRSGKPSIKLCPGFTDTYPLPDTDTRVDLFWWENREYLLATCSKKLYVKTSKLADWEDVTGSTTIPYNTRIFFTADEHGVTLSAGQRMIWWGGDTSTPAQTITDTGAPTEVSGLTSIKGYTVAAETDTQRLYFATYGPTDSRSNPPPWSPIFLEASANPDGIITIASGWEELFVLGRSSTEAHYATGDADIPFTLLNGSVTDVGAINNRTLQKIQGSWVYLTPQKQVVMVQGRQAQPISTQIEYDLHKLDKPKYGEAFTLLNRFYVLTFPPDDKTFVFDFETKLWYEWLDWSQTYYKYIHYPGISAVWAKAWNQQLIGGFGGQVYVCDYSTTNFDSDLIRLQITTGNYDHGTLERKFSPKLKLRIRRGE